MDGCLPPNRMYWFWGSYVLTRLYNVTIRRFKQVVFLSERKPLLNNVRDNNSWKGRVRGGPHKRNLYFLKVHHKTLGYYIWGALEVSVTIKVLSRAHRGQLSELILSQTGRGQGLKALPNHSLNWKHPLSDTYQETPTLWSHCNDQA